MPVKNAVSINTFRSDTTNIVLKYASGLGYPENTEIAFKAASYTDIDTFYISVYKTLDDQCVISSNDNLYYITGKNINISESNLEDISGLNFAYFYTNDGVNYPYRNQPQGCLTINDLFDNYPFFNYIISIEQTGDVGSRAAHIIIESVLDHNVITNVVIKGSEDVINNINKLEYNLLSVSAQNKEISLFNSLSKIYLDNLYLNIDFQYIEVTLDELQGMTKYNINEYHKRNIALYVSDINSLEDLLLIEQYDVDGLITVNPNSLKK